MNSFNDAPFLPDNPPTVGAGFARFDFPSDSTRPIRVWDTAGQEHYRSLASLYYRDSHLVVLVFAVNVTETFDSLPTWITAVKDACAKLPAFMIVGNKIDLRTDHGFSCVSAVDAQDFADSQGAIYMEASAKSGQGVKELFYQASELAYSKWSEGEADPVMAVDPDSTEAPRRNCAKC
jgi:small GTP-binding protein